LEDLKEQIVNLNKLVTPAILANQLGIEHSVLWYLVKLANRDVAKTPGPYTHLQVVTKEKVRDVFSPSDRIRDIQTMLLAVVWSGIDSGKHSYAYEPGMKLTTPGSILENHGLIVGLDFKDFFPSISRKKVKELLMEYGYVEQVASIIATLSCVKFNGFCFLPQGGISSAQIANRIAAQLIDPIVLKYCEDTCKDSQFQYVRYSDNIYISLDKSVTGREFIAGLASVLGENKWRTHKRRVMPYYRRQRVLGMVVNEKVAPPRNELNRFKSALYNIAKCSTKEEIQEQVDRMGGIKVETSKGKGILILSIKGKANYYRDLLIQKSEIASEKLKTRLEAAVKKIEDLY
jgi:RNA-directed DNA polymerase